MTRICTEITQKGKTMQEIHESFDTLFARWKDVFHSTIHASKNYAGLRASIPAKVTGVYIVRDTEQDRIIYIGSSGKIQKQLVPSGSSIRSRLFGSSTPYHFDKATNDFRYGPTSSGVPPKGYSYAVPICSIEVTCIAVACPFAPSVLEHLLLQGHINQFRDLPDANQKI